MDIDNVSVGITVYFKIDPNDPYCRKMCGKKGEVTKIDTETEFVYVKWNDGEITCQDCSWLMTRDDVLKRGKYFHSRSRGSIRFKKAEYREKSRIEYERYHGDLSPELTKLYNIAFNTGWNDHKRVTVVLQNPKK